MMSLRNSTETSNRRGQPPHTVTCAQRLENSVYRERKCNSQLHDFKSIALGEKGMCASVDAWRGAKGAFIPSQFPVVSISLVSADWKICIRSQWQ